MTAPVLYQVGGVLVHPPCPWLPVDTDPVTQLVVHEAHATLGIRESPRGSNRGPQVDAWLRQANVPEAVIRAGQGFWCAAWAGAVWRRAGLEPPTGYYDCDVLWRWARQTNRFSRIPSLGALVLYGKLAIPDAQHVGIVVDVADPTMSIEANTTIEGSAFERNGTAVALKIITPADPVIGFVHLRPLAA